MVTLLEKLDAIARRYARENLEPDNFVRHYEDAAWIIGTVDQLPIMAMSADALAEDMLSRKDISGWPSADDPSLVLGDAGKRSEIERAYRRIDPMFWGPRVPLDEACTVIREWLRSLPRS